MPGIFFTIFYIQQKVIVGKFLPKLPELELGNLTWSHGRDGEVNMLESIVPGEVKVEVLVRVDPAQTVKPWRQH